VCFNTEALRPEPDARHWPLLQRRRSRFASCDAPEGAYPLRHLNLGYRNNECSNLDAERTRFARSDSSIPVTISLPASEWEPVLHCSGHGTTLEDTIREALRRYVAQTPGPLPVPRNVTLTAEDLRSREDPSTVYCRAGPCGTPTLLAQGVWHSSVSLGEALAPVVPG
jgi:hypothetical protein